MRNYFLIITGMGGAGKSLVLRTLEDLGYLCIDNLPDAVVGKFVELGRENSNRNVAIVVDIRGGRSFNELLTLLANLKKSGRMCEMLFMNAEDDILIRRYKESRRRHPLSDLGGTLLDNIRTERELLEPLRMRADSIIDTTILDVSKLKQQIVQRYGETSSSCGLNVKVQSFGFKYGIPLDSDMVVDVRFLPNPFYVDELRELTGKDQAVIDFISKQQQTIKFLNLQNQLLDFLFPCFLKEGKHQLVISVGCTGGRHRSVYVANQVAEHLTTIGFRAEAVHRDIGR